MNGTYRLWEVEDMCSIFNENFRDMMVVLELGFENEFCIKDNQNIITGTK